MTRSTRRVRFQLRLRQRGLSLVEVMISMVIGLVVVGAVLISYIAAIQTNKLQAAYAQMNEDAQIGLYILSRDLLLAGYAKPVGVDPTTSKFGKTFSGPAVFGCDTGFEDPEIAADATCKAGGTMSAIEISYEADRTNTVDVGGFPSDCIGASLEGAAQTVAGAGGNTTYYVTQNRYYLANGNTGRSELHCASRLGNDGEALVDNIDAMKIWYGEANPLDPRQIVRYVSAANVKGPGTDFGFVVSVRVCFLMRSSELVLGGEDSKSYLDCDAATKTSTDGHARRAYFTTTALRNKMTF